MRLSRFCCLLFAAAGTLPLLAQPEGRLSTPDLLRRLRGPEASERASAARSLSRSSPTREVVSALIEALQDEDAKVRRAACYGIRDFGPDAEAGVRPLGRLLQILRPTSAVAPRALWDRWARRPPPWSPT